MRQVGWMQRIYYHNDIFANSHRLDSWTLFIVINAIHVIIRQDKNKSIHIFHILMCNFSMYQTLGKKISTTTKHPHTLIHSSTHTTFSTYITFHTISYILSCWMNNKNTTEQLEKVFYPLVFFFRCMGGVFPQFS